jgi:hypothetical protein
MIKWFSSDYTEVMATGDGQYILRTPYDLIHVRGVSGETITELLEIFDAVGTYDDLEKVFPAASRPEVRDLILRLRQSVSRASRQVTRMEVKAAPPRLSCSRSRPILILGNGRIAQALNQRLRAREFEDTSFIHLAISEALIDDDFRQRARRAIVLPFRGERGDRTVGEPALDGALQADRVLEDATLPALAELMARFQLVICALEDVCHRAIIKVSEAAEQAARPSLYITSGLGTCIVGPLTVPGVTATFFDAYRALCRQSAPELSDDRFLELLRSPATDEVQAGLVADYAAEEVANLLAPSPDSVLFGHLVEVTPTEASPPERDTGSPGHRRACAPDQPWPRGSSILAAPAPRKPPEEEQDPGRCPAEAAVQHPSVARVAATRGVPPAPDAGGGAELACARQLRRAVLAFRLQPLAARPVHLRQRAIGDLPLAGHPVGLAIGRGGLPPLLLLLERLAVSEVGAGHLAAPVVVGRLHQDGVESGHRRGRACRRLR